MPTPTNEKLSMDRNLSDYALRFRNDEFPLLSFIYAVMAGGEHALYCDHTNDFVNAYLGRAMGRPYIRAFLEIMGAFVEMSGNIDPKLRTRVVHASKDDWAKIMPLLELELNAGKEPVPNW